MAEFPRITRQSHVVGGRACLRDTGITVSTVVALAATGRSQEEIIRIFPELISDDVREALAYAAWLIDEKDVDIPGKPRPSPLFIRSGQGKRAYALTESMHGISQPESQANAGSDADAKVENTEASKTSEALETPEALEVPEIEESMELFHPDYPDQPTVVVTRHGLLDRRWSDNLIDWSDIRAIKYVSGKKTIRVTLSDPQSYLSSMPFFQRQIMGIKLALHRNTILIDTASLGIRTKDLFLTINRLWVLHSGTLRLRKKRRIKSGKKTGRTEQDRLWNSLQPM